MSDSIHNLREEHLNTFETVAYVERQTQLIEDHHRRTRLYNHGAVLYDAEITATLRAKLRAVQQSIEAQAPPAHYQCNPPAKPAISLDEGDVLLLKAVRYDRRAYRNYNVQYPASGPFKPASRMHAFLWGTTPDLSELFPYTDSAFVRYGHCFLVIRAKRRDVFPAASEGSLSRGHVVVYSYAPCEVVYCGDKQTAISLIREHAPADTVWPIGWYEQPESDKVAADVVPVAAVRPYVVGQSYPVAVAQLWEDAFYGTATVPLMGPKHNDREIIRFEEDHYHVDWRFVDPAVWADRFGSYEKFLTAYRLIIPSTLVKSITTRHLTCQRDFPLPYPAKAFEWLLELEEAYESATMGPKRICPHRNADLSTITPDESGVVTCPLHGLRWCTHTGKLQPRQTSRE